MRVEQAVYYQLSNDAGVTALVGNRIWPIVAKLDQSFPQLTYQRLGMEPYHAMGADSDLRGVHIGIACIGKTYSSVKDVQHAVEASLTDFKGTMGGAGGVWVDRVFIDDLAETFEEDVEVYIVRLDYLFHVRES